MEKLDKSKSNEAWQLKDDLKVVFNFEFICNILSPTYFNIYYYTTNSIQ